MSISIGILRETGPDENRVALVPEVVSKLVRSGHRVVVEPGAGEKAYFPDSLYQEAGAAVGTGSYEAQIIVKVQPPSSEEVARIPAGTLVAGFFDPLRNPKPALALAEQGASVLALELVPRISRAQAMDALSSQAAVAGYKAALTGANASPRFFPMLTTAAGTVKPANVVVLGAGVAGLQAIATAKRLGAVVLAYDVRRAAAEQVLSLGAKFIGAELNAEAAGGYARELTREEKAQEEVMLADALAKADVVITTAQIPGRPAPRLVSAAIVARMKPGAVIVDLAAESGGNCELTVAGQEVIQGGVRILGPRNLPAQMAHDASQLLARNFQALLGLIIDSSGNLNLDLADEIIAASLIVDRGEVRDARLTSGGQS